MNEELNDYSLSNLQQKHNILHGMGTVERAERKKQEMAVGIIPNLVVLSWYIRLCTLGSRNSQAFVAGHSSGFCKRNESDSGGASPFCRFEAILTRYLQHPQKQMTNPSKSLRPYH